MAKYKCLASYNVQNLVKKFSLKKTSNGLYEGVVPLHCLGSLFELIDKPVTKKSGKSDKMELKKEANEKTTIKGRTDNGGTNTQTKGSNSLN